MTDWKALAAARCPDIPAEAVAGMVPALEAMEAAFRPLAGQLRPEDESALTFTNVKERSE
jgi:hypothetical protein